VISERKNVRIIAALRGSGLLKDEANNYFSHFAFYTHNVAHQPACKEQWPAALERKSLCLDVGLDNNYLADKTRRVVSGRLEM